MKGRYTPAKMNPNSSRTVINARGKEYSVRDTLKISNGKVSRIYRNKRRTLPFGERVLVIPQ